MALVKIYESVVA